MILLDTSVVAEAMKPDPEPAVLAWLDAQKAESLYITSVTIAELLTGIGSLPGGMAKDELAKALDRTMQVFSGRVLTFDTIAAWSYADLVVRAKKRAKSYAMADAYIAAIATAHGMPIASRNIGILESFGLLAINPWTDAA